MPERVASTLSQAHVFRSAACVRLRRGASAAHPRDSDGHPMATRRVTNRQSEDPGPCRRCAAALSSAADAPTYITLGSHAKSGLHMRRSPGRAVTCGHRNGASLSAKQVKEGYTSLTCSTDATNPAAWRRGSTHPDHRMRGLSRVLPAGENRIANGCGYSDAACAPSKSHVLAHRPNRTRILQALPAAVGTSESGPSFL